MGDRGNIAIQTDGKRVYLYGHHSGSEMPEIVRRALARQQRWDDPPYLARIIFCELVGDDKGATGYGISATIDDNEHPIIVVDTDKQTVTIEAETDGMHGPRGRAQVIAFADYAALHSADFATLDDYHATDED